MNKQIRRLGVALLVMYGALFVQLNVWQVLRADELNSHPSNTRPVVRNFSRERGSIQTADGEVVARSVEVDTEFERRREYPEGDLFAHVTGYFSFEFGATGLEREYNDELAGRNLDLEVDQLGDLFVDRTRTADLTMTIRKDVQQAARDALGQREGAVAAVDPRTGAVLALWSYPSYDPTALSDHDLTAARQARNGLIDAPGNPLVPSAYRERYFPGSTFKVITASAGLESGEVTRDHVTGDRPAYPSSNAYTPPLTRRPIRNFGGSTCGGDLFQILRVSCNTAFAEMGVDLGPETMVRTAEAYGFDSRPPLDVQPGPVASAFPPVGFFDQNTPLLAQSAIGQNEVQATPLQMALAAAAVANRGEIMRPYLAAEIRDSDGELVDRASPERWRTAISPQTAATMREAMLGVVQSGTARGLAIPGEEVGGKTGTAQLGTSPPRSHAWIVGFAGPPGEARVAVAVIVEGQPGASEQTGGRVAAPIARAVMERVLATQ